MRPEWYDFRPDSPTFGIPLDQMVSSAFHITVQLTSSGPRQASFYARCSRQHSPKCLTNSDKWPSGASTTGLPFHQTQSAYPSFALPSEMAK